MLLCLAVLFLDPALIGGSVGEDGVCDRVGGEALHTVQDMANRQLGLKEEVELAVRQADCHMQNPSRRDSGFVSP